MATECLSSVVTEHEAKGLGLEMISSRICNWKIAIIAGILSHLTTLSFLNSPISVKQSLIGVCVEIHPLVGKVPTSILYLKLGPNQ